MALDEGMTVHVANRFYITVKHDLNDSAISITNCSWLLPLCLKKYAQEVHKTRQSAP